VAKPYRGFEFLSLRHTVWDAEKPGSNPRKIARNGRNFANLAIKPDRRNARRYPAGKRNGPYSLKGTLAVRFQQLGRANTRRSQTDDAAKSGLHFFVHAFDFYLRPYSPRTLRQSRFAWCRGSVNEDRIASLSTSLSRSPPTSLRRRKAALRDSSRRAQCPCAKL
jgi:hypothetical protein